MIFEQRPLSELCSLTNGYPFKSKDFCEHGVPVIKIANVKPNRILSDNLQCVTESVAKLAIRAKIKKGDILLTLTGNRFEGTPDSWVGKSAQFNLDGMYLLNQRLCIVRPNSSIDPAFLAYALASWDSQLYFVKHSTSSGGQANISPRTVADYVISYPPVAVQRKISGILKALDNKIALNNKLNDNLEQQAIAFYEQITRNSKKARLECLLATVESGSRPKGGAESTGIPSIGAEKIERFGIYDYGSEKYISKDYFEKLKRGRVLSGDVLLYKDGAYTGKVSMALDGFPHKECAVNEHVFLLRTQSAFAQYFLYFTLLSPSIRSKIFTLASGKAAQPGLNQQELLGVEIPLPDFEDIVSFENQVDPFMHTIATNALENRKLEQLRDSLLPKLMSGELDVSIVEF